jgi:NifB/MoaA-like Fe-S oxidoreductase
MEQPLVAQMKIPATESKREYLQQMEEICERWARQLEGRELDICIKEMHVHMRGTELKEEELQECEEALKKREEELAIREWELQKWKKKSHTSFNCTQ